MIICGREKIYKESYNIMTFILCLIQFRVNFLYAYSTFNVDRIWYDKGMTSPKQINLIFKQNKHMFILNNKTISISTALKD